MQLGRHQLWLDRAFENCTIKLRAKGAVQIVRESPFDPHGTKEKPWNYCSPL